MKVNLDTNVLLRLIVGDDDAQQQSAAEVLERAESVTISTHALCEFAWVLHRRYDASRVDISYAIRQILDMRNLIADRPAIDAGLAMLDAGGDFADGVIAYHGRWLGAETFLSFDRKAVRLVERQGFSAMLLP